jgi:hypothetical protein
VHKTIHVELVGGESTDVLGIPGPVFVAVAAVIAAVLAAAVTVWKMRRDLAHDREMRDREDARNVLYAALDAIEELVKDVNDLIQTVRTIGTAIENEDDLTSAQVKFDSLRADLDKEVNRLNSLAIRTQVRFTSRRFGRAIKLLREDAIKTAETLDQGRARAFTEAEWNEALKTHRQVTRGAAVFMALTYEWFTDDKMKDGKDDENTIEQYLARAE